MSFIGSTLGNIRIESRLGAGGMGEVYLGFDRRLERRVALKTIRPEQRLSPAVKARFLREARLLSKLGHPGICQVYDLLETSEADFLVLEYIEGKTLRQLAVEEDLPLERKLRLAVKIAGALAAAHREQVVHRDLKPENVMVTPAGEVKVLDFGVARSLSEAPVPAAEVQSLPGPVAEADTQPAVMAAAWMPPSLAEESGATHDSEALTHFGTVVGTIWTMSPEQASGQPVTTASDLYSFGILLQELLTGKPVYTGGSMQDVWRQVVRAETAPMTGLDPDVATLVSDLLNLDPRRRPTAEQARERLLWILDKPQRLRRRRLRLALVSGAFAILVVLLAVVTWLAAEAERARREADQRRRQAEDLIGFMLGDLRPKLEEVGRLDILDEVGDRAMAYFQAVPRASWSDEELARRAEAILQIGQVRWSQGSLPQALATFRATAVLADELARRVLLERGNAAGALAEMRQSTSLFQELSAQDPTNVDWRRQLGISQGRTATALLALDPVTARAEARHALTLLAPLAAGSPDESLRGYAADAAVALGRAEEALGNAPDARAAREKALSFLAGCRRPLRHWKLLDPWIQAELGLGRRDEAIPELRRLLAMGYRGREIIALARREGVGRPENAREATTGLARRSGEGPLSAAAESGHRDCPTNPRPALESRS